MKTSFAAFFLLLVAAPITRAEMPEFAYPQNNAIAFYPTAALHKGDVLQVRSPRLLGDETLVLARCDDGCKDATVISVYMEQARLPSCDRHLQSPDTQQLHPEARRTLLLPARQE